MKQSAIPTKDGDDLATNVNTEERATWLASFPERNPNPILEVDLAGATIYYANPAALRLRPEVLKLGIEHPLLVNLGEIEKDLSSGKRPTARREVAFGEQFFAQTITYIPEAGRLRIYSSDITERKQSESAVTLLAAIVESSEDAIIGKDLNGIVSSWNGGAQKIFGYSAAEMIGNPILRLIPTERQQEETKILEKLRRGEKVLHFETVRHAKDGRLIDVSVTVSPIKDSDGRVVGASKVARDITGRKQAEREIRTLNLQLEQRVAERTTQLQIANKELEAFSYSVSHDLRAPLRHVSGFVELLKNDAAPTLSEKSIQYLKTISKATKRMGDLIDDLLTFSRIGRTEMCKTNINLDELVAETLLELQEETKGRDLVWEINPLPLGYGDRPMLRQVLVNLLANAIKFTRNCKPARIEISTAPTKEPEVIILVRDNGAGFDPKYIDKLFGVFQRLHSSNDFEGTGIGLANVQRIVQRHGGRVWAQGTINQGATFYFTLPHSTEGLMI